MASLGEELLNIVNRLQDLVFNTIGNDSLDLPQIVRLSYLSTRGTAYPGNIFHTFTSGIGYFVANMCRLS